MWFEVITACTLIVSNSYSYLSLVQIGSFNLWRILNCQIIQAGKFICVCKLLNEPHINYQRMLACNCFVIVTMLKPKNTRLMKYEIC